MLSARAISSPVVLETRSGRSSVAKFLWFPLRASLLGLQIPSAMAVPGLPSVLYVTFVYFGCFFFIILKIKIIKTILRVK